MVSSTFAFIVFVLGFGFLIFIHELGHFAVAKWVGIRCTQFAIGFGPAIFSWRKGLGIRVGSTEPAYEAAVAEHCKTHDLPEPTNGEEMQKIGDALGLGETEYRLNYLPLGGYVKMLGQEDLDPAARSSNPNAFGNKSVGARFAVISAGVIMNMITGIIFFMIAFTAGVDFPPAVVGPMASDSPAAKAHAVGHENDERYRGLRIGDRIVAIDGEEPMDYMDARVAAALGAEGTPREVTVAREGEPAPLVYRITPEYEDGLLSFGIDQPVTLEAAIVERNSDAYKAGLASGMYATEADGQKLTSYAQLERIVTEAKGRPVTVVYEATDGMDKVREREERIAKELDVPARELQPRVEFAMKALPPLRGATADEPANVAGFVPAVRVHRVIKDGVAEAAGLRDGDILRQVGPVSWPTLDEVSETISNAPGALEFSVLRGGEVVVIDEVKPAKGRVGIELVSILDEPIVGSRIDESPASGLQSLSGGFRIVSVNGQAIADWADLYRTFGALDVRGDHVNVPVQFVPAIGDGAMEPENGELTLTAEQVAQFAGAQWLPQPGVRFEFLKEPMVANGPIDAAVLGLRKTKSFIMQTYVMILRLFQGSVGVDQLHGPVGITAVGHRVAETGWTYLLYFLGILSVNLAVINFLPIPIADGGHAVFLLVEKLKGSPVSAKVQVGAMYVGLVLLGGLFLFVTYNDIVRLVMGQG